MGRITRVVKPKAPAIATHMRFTNSTPPAKETSLVPLATPSTGHQDQSSRKSFSWEDPAKITAAIAVGAGTTYLKTHEDLKKALEAQEQTKRDTQNVIIAKEAELKASKKTQEQTKRDAQKEKKQKEEELAKKEKEAAQAQQLAEEERAKRILTEEKIKEEQEKSKTTLTLLQKRINQDLLTAIHEQNLTEFEKLLTTKEGANPNNLNDALKVALNIKPPRNRYRFWSFNDKVKNTMIKKLVEAGGNVKIVYDWANQHNHTGMLKWIVTHYPNEERALMALNQAARSGSIDLAKAAMPHATDSAKNDALLTAVNTGNKDFVKYLLSNNPTKEALDKVTSLSMYQPEIHKMLQEYQKKTSSTPSKELSESMLSE